MECFKGKCAVDGWVVARDRVEAYILILWAVAVSMSDVPEKDQGVYVIVIPWAVCLYVALASGLSCVQVDKHGITILYHLHQCRPCASRYISC